MTDDLQNALDLNSLLVTHLEEYDRAGELAKADGINLEKYLEEARKSSQPIADRLLALERLVNVQEKVLAKQREVLGLHERDLQKLQAETDKLRDQVRSSLNSSGAPPGEHSTE